MGKIIQVLGLIADIIIEIIILILSFLFHIAIILLIIVIHEAHYIENRIKKIIHFLDENGIIITDKKTKQAKQYLEECVNHIKLFIINLLSIPS